jgi:lysozyme family protein
MSIDIKKLIDAVITREGGYVNHPADRGGPTNMGITQKTLTDYFGKQQQVADVYNLSKQTAREIYYQKYYVRYDIQSLPELIQPIMLDMVVHHGKRGIKLLQDALLSRGYDVGKIDGYTGPKTIKASRQAAEDMGNQLIRSLVRRRILLFEALVRADENQRVFMPGWISRAESFLPETV